MNCLDCRGKDRSFTAYTLHQVCGNCWASRDALAVCFHKAHCFDAAAVSAQLADCLGRSLTDYKLSKSHVAQFGLPDALKDSLKSAEKAGFAEILLVSPWPLEQFLPHVLAATVRSKVWVLVTSPDLTQTWLVYQHGDVSSTYSLLIDYLEAYAEAGYLLRSESAIARHFKGYTDLHEALTRAEQLGVLERKVHGSRKVVSLQKPVLDCQAVAWAIAALETAGIVPQLFRVVDVLAGSFGLVVEPETVLEVFGMIGTPNCEFSDQPVLSLCGVEPQFEDSAWTDSYLPVGVYSQAVDLWPVHRRSTSFRDLYLWLEQQQNIPRLSKRRVKALIRLVMEETGTVEFKRLTSLVNSLSSPVLIDPNYIKALVCQTSDLVYRYGEVRVSANNEAECPICMDVLTQGFCTLSCSHQFHAQCFKDFLSSMKILSLLCPVCRSQLDRTEVLELFRQARIKPPAVLSADRLAPAGVCKVQRRRLATRPRHSEV